MKPKTYFICATPRSGSYFLSYGLRSTNVCGYPDEYFCGNITLLWLEWLKLRVDSFKDYLNQLRESRSTSNRVFGVKIMWEDLNKSLQPYLNRLPECADKPLHEQIAVAFQNPFYIHITRRDKVRQAISMVKAFQTNSWLKMNNMSDQGDAPRVDPTFHFDTINHWVQQFTWMDNQWRDFFARSGITPYTVVYEDLVNNFEATINEILKFMEIPITEEYRPPEMQTEKQADAISEEWYRLYEQTVKDLGYSNLEEAPAGAALLWQAYHRIRKRLEACEDANLSNKVFLEQSPTENPTQLDLPRHYMELVARSAYRRLLPLQLRLRLRDARQRLHKS